MAQNNTEINNFFMALFFNYLFISLNIQPSLGIDNPSSAEVIDRSIIVNLEF